MTTPKSGPAVHCRSLLGLIFGTGQLEDARLAAQHREKDRLCQQSHLRREVSRSQAEGVAGEDKVKVAVVDEEQVIFGSSLHAWLLPKASPCM